AGDGQGGGADALDAHAELLQVEAEVLDHVVGGGVADHRGAGVEGGRHQGVLGDGVAPRGEHDRPTRLDAGGDRWVVAALGRVDVEAEGAQRVEVRLHGAVTEVAADGVGQVEDLLAVQQRAEEYDDRPGAPRRVGVDVGQVEVRRRDDLEVAGVVEP